MAALCIPLTDSITLETEHEQIGEATAHDLGPPSLYLFDRRWRGSGSPALDVADRLLQQLMATS
jgi:hypothetical protein